VSVRYIARHGPTLLSSYHNWGAKTCVFLRFNWWTRLLDGHFSSPGRFSGPYTSGFGIIMNTVNAEFKPGDLDMLEDGEADG
jgi:hypothetical protein